MWLHGSTKCIAVKLHSGAKLMLRVYLLFVLGFLELSVHFMHANYGSLPARCSCIPAVICFCNVCFYVNPPTHILYFRATESSNYICLDFFFVWLAHIPKAWELCECLFFFQFHTFHTALKLEEIWPLWKCLMSLSFAFCYAWTYASIFLAVACKL